MAKEIYNDEQLREKIMAAARAAVREGIMPGGGVAFLHVLPAVEALRRRRRNCWPRPRQWPAARIRRWKWCRAFSERILPDLPGM